ncbi:hypothetical protein [Methylobacter sp.]|uniref:hypothetical protein n=1 Tax=Methylobacter sp. TaxID=2051955 RepID=UPI001206E3B3|nr:hypothetical protein [Methylobacter sp.]TAK59524.1 MAG: hypothetical protein EPO18_20395 [Methylobacter sp.]
MALELKREPGMQSSKYCLVDTATGKIVRWNISEEETKKPLLLECGACPWNVEQIHDEVAHVSKEVFVISPPAYSHGAYEVRWKEHYCEGTGRMAITPTEAELCTSCDKKLSMSGPPCRGCGGPTAYTSDGLECMVCG